MKHLHKLGALVLCGLVLFSLVLPALASSPTSISIRTAEDLEQLAQSCSLDTWSQGKTVVLEEDLDLSGQSFTPIPTFGGTFDGQGHTISGLSVTAGGSVQGLFRYVQQGAVIRNLNVTGSVMPSGTRSTVGGIAGSNRGLISNCSFQGTVRGAKLVGGLVGVNESSGQLIACTFTGGASGEHYVGGIAGQNLGSLIQCRNRGSVNTLEVKSTLSLDTLDLEDINSANNLPASTDIGGIAGFSSGILQSCRNEGAVGYEHTGYNVGGIVGRQSGYLAGCTNTGSVYGRKDVGGIAGQMEPELLVKYGEDSLQRLWKELDTLQSMTGRLLNDTDQASDALTSSLSSLTDRAKTAKDRTSDLADGLSNWASDNIDSVQDVSARVSWALDQLAPVLDTGGDAAKDLERAMDELEQAMESGELLSQLGQDAATRLSQALDQVSPPFQQAIQSLDAIKAAQQALLDALLAGDQEAMTAAVAALQENAGNLKNAAAGLATAVGNFADALHSLSPMGSQGEELFSHLADTADRLEASAGHLSDMAEDLGDIVQDLSDRPAISFRPVDSVLTQASDDLDTAMTDLLDGMDQLTNTLSTSQDTVLSDLKAIHQQLQVVIDVLRDAVQSPSEETDSLSDRFEDISDWDDSLDTGLIMQSQNTGSVSGDINVAGIAGSLAVEYDFDPEDDLTSIGSRSLDFRYQARAVVRECVNQGKITSKKDCAGGITGRMDLGRVSGCENYGAVSSTDGNYVGGIAGASYSVIRDCWSKCVLSGGHYVGGVAGYAVTLMSCRSLVCVSGGEEYLGAVAGNLDPEGEVSGNLFVPNGIAAIDGISYSGKAEPISFSELEGMGGMPSGFSSFQLVFQADGKTVATIPFSYGDSLDSLPEVPEKEGYTGAWPQLDLDHLTFSQTLEAIYTPYSSALAPEEAQPPQILVDGSFSQDAQISHSSAPVSWTDSNGHSHEGTAYTVTIQDPVLDLPDYTIHYRLTQAKGHPTLWVQEDGIWQQEEFQIDGSYLLFPANAAQVTFCVEEEGAGPWLFVLLGCGGVLIIVAGILLYKKIKSKPKITQS